MKKFIILIALALINFQLMAGEDFTALVNELSGKVASVNSKMGVFEQTIEEKELGEITLLSSLTTNQGAKKNTTYSICLSDIFSVKVKMSANSNTVKLIVKDGKKLIKVMAVGKTTIYANSVAIAVTDISNAQEIKAIVEKMIPLAKSMLFSTVPGTNDATEIFEFLNEKIADIELGDKEFMQSFTQDELTNFSVIETKANKSVHNIYRFNLIDIDEKSIDYKITGADLAVQFKTLKKIRLIKVTKDEKLMPYKNKLVINCSNSNDAKIIISLLKRLSQNAKKDYQQLVPAEGSDAIAAWLKENVGDAKVGKKTISQSIKLKSDMIELMVTSKKLEMAYKFSIRDINKVSVRYKIVGKSLTVYFETNNKEELIMVYKNGMLNDYKRDAVILFDDIELARNTIYALKELISEHK